MSELNFLSDQDVELLRGLLREAGHRRHNTERRPRYPEPDHQAPEVYVALTPSGGIAAYDIDHPTGTGTGSSYFDAGYADCRIFRLIYNNPDWDCYPAGFNRTVFNITGTPISGNAFVVVTRDKYGSWMAVSPASVSSPGTTGPQLSINHAAAYQQPGQVWIVYGSVTPTPTSSTSITVSGDGSATGIVAADGTFNISISTSISNIGSKANLKLVASDAIGNTSVPVNVTLTQMFPILSMSQPTWNPIAGQYTFSGYCYDDFDGCSAGLTVTLHSSVGAINGNTATVQSDGSWTTTLTVAHSAGSIVTASVTDWYGITMWTGNFTLS